MCVGRRKPLGGRGIGTGSERLGRLVVGGDEQRRVSQSREVKRQKGEVGVHLQNGSEASNEAQRCVAYRVH